MAERPRLAVVNFRINVYTWKGGSCFMQSIVLNINDDSKVQSLLSLLRDLQYVDVKQLEQVVKPKPIDWLESLSRLADQTNASSNGEKWTRDELYRV
jgi:hypothetical protein